MKALTRARLTGTDSNFAVFDLNYGVEIRVGIVDDGIGRIVTRRNGGYRLDRTWCIAPDSQDPPFAGRNRDDLSGFSCPPVTVTEHQGAVAIDSASLRAIVTLEPFGIAWQRSGDVAPFLSDRRTQAYFVSRKTTAFAHYTERYGGDRHYGLSDKAGPLDRTGRRFRIDAVDPCGFDAELSDPLYKMIPFVAVSGEAGCYGLYYDNLATADVDLGATIDNYHGLFRAYRADDGDLDLYVLAGPTLPSVVTSFSRLTGGQAFAPKWTLGFAMTSMAIADADDADAQIAELIDNCARHRIPCDSFHFGSGYAMHEGKRLVFEWNRTKFPDPAATLARLSAAGMRTVANIKPCLLNEHPRLRELTGAGGLVLDSETGQPSLAQFWDGLGYHVDFTNPAGREWWGDRLEQALLDNGVTAAWNDNNEFEIWDEDAVADGDSRPFPLALARPVQALLMTKLAHETQTRHAPGKRPYTISRAGPAGISRYGQTWSGDNATNWKTLRFNLAQGLNMSLSGMFNIGHDVGGFHGPSPGPELLCRFVEFCAFWPRFVMNSWNSDGLTTLPWMHDEVADPIRDVIRLRYRLMPYFYALMWKAASENVPPVRPVFYDFPEDSAATTVEDAFMLGPDLLVAPVLMEGALNRPVYFPANPGGWYNLHDGSHLEGGLTREIDAPLGRTPLFIRSGAMIPFGNVTDRLAPDLDTARALVIYGNPSASITTLYDDDGDTASWKDGSSLVTNILLEREADSTNITVMAEGRYRPAWRTLQISSVHGVPLNLKASDCIHAEIAS